MTEKSAECRTVKVHYIFFFFALAFSNLLYLLRWFVDSRVLSAHILKQHGRALQKWRDDAGSALPPVGSCLLLCQWTGRDWDGPVSWRKSVFFNQTSKALLFIIFYYLKVALINYYGHACGDVNNIISGTIERVDAFCIMCSQLTLIRAWEKPFLTSPEGSFVLERKMDSNTEALCISMSCIIKLFPLV